MIIFVVPKYLSAGVINSQVIQMARHVRPDKQRVMYVYGDKNLLGNGLMDPNDWRLTIRYFKNFSDLSSDLLRAEKIYLRSYHFLWKILAIKWFRNRRLQVVFDFRGLLYMESWYRHKSFIRSAVLYIIEFFVYATADHICAVSNALSIELKRHFFTRKINVIPCAIEKATKRSTEVHGHPLRFVYVGSLSKWQQFDRVLRVFEAVCQKMPATLSVFTFDVEEARKIIDNSRIEVKELISLRQNEVINRLAGFDFGFLLRENHIINRVASPIKFLEYISCGVIPIVTQYVGDYSADVNQQRLGYVLENEEVEPEKLLALFNDTQIAERLFKYAIAHTWEALLKDHPLNK